MAQTEIDLSGFFPASLKITKVTNKKERINIFIKSQTHIQTCPSCKQDCNEYHSTYRRKIQDLPILGKAVTIHLSAYRYYCHDSECKQKVFCETADGFFGFYKRMTGRLEDFVIALALNTSCEGASRVCGLLGISVSGDTLIRMIIMKANGLAPVKTDIIGVDDWAYKKGSTYGTIIVDGRTHKPIDLLDGRDGKTLKEWLKKNQQVKIVTRDRASAYASAISEVLPQAMQIADRFHLYQNLLVAIKNVTVQEIPAKVKIMQNSAQEAVQQGKNKKNFARIAEKQNLIQEVQALLREGSTKRKIAKVLKISRNTVYKYSSGSPELLAENSRPAFIKQEPFQQEIISMINNKIIRKDVYFAIVKKGYAGGRTQFYKYCEHLAEMEMLESPGNLRIDELRDEQTKLKYHYVTRNQIFKYVWSGTGDIGKDDIEFIKTSFPVLKVLSDCLFQFKNIFEKKSKEALLEFITSYKDCELVSIKSFIKSIQKDIDPITNAVVEKYSNGFVEGTNNKLKAIKRVGYGRCKLPLLKSKIVLPAFFWP